jgi:hypothetical protein
MDSDQLKLLERLTTEGTRERTALIELVPRVRKSEASVLSALVALGGRAVREQALADGYAELAARHCCPSSQTGTDDGSLLEGEEHE